MTMTREEQIIEIGAQFAIDETDGQTSGRAASMRGVLLSAFRAGAHWADQHPAWESVKDSLPEDDECCLIYGDCGIDIGSYNSKTQYWLSEYSGQPTHWMPLPEAPRKEE